MRPGAKGRPGVADEPATTDEPGGPDGTAVASASVRLLSPTRTAVSASHDVRSGRAASAIEVSVSSVISVGVRRPPRARLIWPPQPLPLRSEEHTSELQ